MPFVLSCFSTKLSKSFCCIGPSIRDVRTEGGGGQRNADKGRGSKQPFLRVFVMDGPLSLLHGIPLVRACSVRPRSTPATVVAVETHTKRICPMHFVIRKHFSFSAAIVALFSIQFTWCSIINEFGVCWPICYRSLCSVLAGAFWYDVAGLLYDITLNYDYSFYFVSCSFCTSGCLICILSCIR